MKVVASSLLTVLVALVLNPVASAAPAPASGDTYTLSALGSGQCLDVYSGSLADETKLIQWPCAGYDNQTWQLQSNDGVYFRLVAHHSRKCLDVSSGSSADGVPVIQWPCLDGFNQQWRLSARADGSYNLIARHSGKCLDVSGASKNNAAPVIQWTCHGGANQGWVLHAPQILAAGDIAACYDPSTKAGVQATADQISSQVAIQPRSRVLQLGDLAYDEGSTANFACYNDYWGKFKSISYPVPGNHEYASGNANGYYSYFGSRSVPPNGYYSYDWAGWHFIALNANCGFVGGCGPGSAQEQWLRADLAAHPSACTLAYWHQPRFSSGLHGSDATYAAFWADLVAARVDVILNGHDHDYERFAPQDAAGVANAAGPVEFVVGTGGRSVRPLNSPRAANSVASQDSTLGILKLELRANSYSWSFLPVSGSYRDSGEARCT
ncbi:MAG: RICIN domain-containing protein [Chloroflexota bacterium]